MGDLIERLKRKMFGPVWICIECSSCHEENLIQEDTNIWTCWSCEQRQANWTFVPIPRG